MDSLPPSEVGFSSVVTGGDVRVSFADREARLVQEYQDALERVNNVEAQLTTLEG